MKKTYLQYFRISSKIIYDILPGAGLLIVLDYLFEFGWPHIAAVLVTAVFQALIHCSEEKGLRLQLWGILAALNICVLIYFFRKGEMSDFTLMLFGLEAVCAAISVLCYLLRHRLWVKLPIALGLSAVLVYFSLQQTALYKWEVCLFLLYFLLFLSETAEKKFSRPVKQSSNNMLYLFPLFLATVFLLYTLPSKPEPIRWERLKAGIRMASENAKDVFDSVELLFSDKDSSYSMSFAGYDSDGFLGGSIFTTDLPQLTVKGVGTKSPIYLSGSIFGEYTGQNWKPLKERKPYEGIEYLLNYNEIKSALDNTIYSPEEIRELIHPCTYNIAFENLRTESLFITPFTKNVVFFSNASLAAKQGDSLTIEKPKKKGFNYDVSVMELDYTNEKTVEFLRQKAFKELPEESSEEEKRRTFIHDAYTGLPDTLPERVKVLAHEITAGFDNDYDKLKAIEAYLKEYTYITTPETVPKGEDFTDYFLFESKSGYCTYFATAMAVLARCEGIPTRYVEGFATTKTIGKKFEPVSITGGDSHAWPEAYIDQVGFIPFEPTPGYQENIYNAWEVTKKPADYGQIGAVQQKEVEPVIADETESTEVTTQNIDIKGVLLRMLGLLLSFAMLVIVLCVVVTIRRTLRRNVYQKKTEYDKMLYLMQKVLHFLELFQIPIKNGETLTDCEIRIQGALDTETAAFLNICELFQSIRFGGKEVSDSDIRSMEQYVLELEKNYIEKCSWFRKTWYACIK